MASTHGGSEASNGCVVREHLPQDPGGESRGSPVQSWSRGQAWGTGWIGSQGWAP